MGDQTPIDTDRKRRTLSAADLAERTGKTARHFQKLFQEGKIDFATQPGGPGTTIYYDEEGFEAWWSGGRKIRRRKWPTSTGEAGSPGRGKRTKGWKSASPLEQRLRDKLKSVSTSG